MKESPHVYCNVIHNNQDVATNLHAHQWIYEENVACNIVEYYSALKKKKILTSAKNR